MFRLDDPETSKGGAQSVAGRVRKFQSELASVIVSAEEPLTAIEAATKAAELYGGSAESYRKRVHEVEREGRIKSLGVVECSATGKKAMAYMEVQNARNDD